MWGRTQVRLCVAVQVSSVHWSVTRQEQFVLSASWDGSVRLVSATLHTLMVCTKMHSILLLVWGIVPRVEDCKGHVETLSE